MTSNTHKREENTRLLENDFSNQMLLNNLQYRGSSCLNKQQNSYCGTQRNTRTMALMLGGLPLREVEVDAGVVRNYVWPSRGSYLYRSRELSILWMGARSPIRSSSKKWWLRERGTSWLKMKESSFMNGTKWNTIGRWPNSVFSTLWCQWWYWYQVFFAWWILYCGVTIGQIHKITITTLIIWSTAIMWFKSIS